jgi:hypothetical protein
VRIVRSIGCEAFSFLKGWVERSGARGYKRRICLPLVVTPFLILQLQTDIRHNNERCRETANEHEFTMESTIDSFVVDRRNVLDRIPGTFAGVGSKSSS